MFNINPGQKVILIKLIKIKQLSRMKLKGQNFLILLKQILFLILFLWMRT